MTDITVPTFQTLGAGAAEGADRMSHIVLGPEKHARVSETVGAFGTIAKYIAGINDTARDWETEYEDFVDYGEVHDTHYIASQYQRAYTDYQDYQYQDYSYQETSPQLVYPPTEDSYYDYPYPDQEHFLPSQTERISNNFLAEPAYYGYYGVLLSTTE